MNAIAGRGEPDLGSVLERSLPIGERLLDLRSDAGVTTATIVGPEGCQIAIEWWRGKPERPSYRDGRVLRFAYRGASEAIDGARVSSIVAALRSHEAELAALPHRHEAPSRHRRHERIVFLRETELTMRVALARPRAGSLAAAVCAALDREVEAGPLHRLMLYFETRCRQACEFCEEPGRRDRPLARMAARALRLQHAIEADLVSLGAIDAVLGWMRERPEEPVLHVTGHDWLEHPHLDALLASLERNPGVPLRLQGPSTKLSDPALARRIARLPGLELVATTLQSSDPREHDAIVGRPGAHRQLVAALDAMETAGARVSLSVVLTRRTLRTLPATLSWLAERGLSSGALLQAFIPDRAMRGAETALAPLDEMRAALRDVEPGALAALVGVPTCVVPPALRSMVAPAIETDLREPAWYARACGSCAARGECSGAPESYRTSFGERGFEPLP